MPKARKTHDGEVGIHCPACHCVHSMDARWKFNGDFERPTFLPSLHIWHDAKPEGNIPAYRCHSFITDGRIKFLDDCTHELKGQTVDLPEVSVAES